jgi:uncharacterized protein with GYD domain
VGLWFTGRGARKDEEKPRFGERQRTQPVEMKKILLSRKEKSMARYISLIKFTEQGARNIRKSTSRAHEFDRAAAKAGVKIEGQYWTLGAYDGVLVISADNERKALHCLTELASSGNVHTETLPAFVDKEFDAIVRK